MAAEQSTAPTETHKAHKLNTVAGLRALPPSNEPYWVPLGSEGAFLGYWKSPKKPDAPGVWKARLWGLRPDGKRGQQYTTLPKGLDYNEAVKKAREWVEHINGGGDNSGEVTVAEACRRYAEKRETTYVNKKKPSAAAAAAMRQAHKRLINATKLGRTPLLKLREADVIDWRDALVASKTKRGGERSPASINRDLCDLRAALNFAWKSKLVLSNAAWLSALAPLPGGTVARELYLDLDQRRRLVEHCDPDTARFVQALCMLPLRPGAVAALTAGCYDKKTHVLTIRTDKANGNRQVHLPPKAAAFFAEQLKEGNVAKLPDAPLFTYQGRAWDKDTWKNPIKDARGRAELPEKTVAYTLRHSGITDMVRAGVALSKVAYVAGTSVQQIEKHYAHLQPSDATDALAALAL